MAIVKYPHHVQKLLAWMDSNWRMITLIFVILSLFILWSLYLWGAAAKAVIDDLRREQVATYQVYEQQARTVRGQRLDRKHGYPAAVIYEPGKKPYYRDKQGRKCSFV